MSTYYLNCSGKEHIDGYASDERLLDCSKLLFINHKELRKQKSVAFIKVYNPEIIKMIPDFSRFLVKELIKPINKNDAQVS